MPINIDDTESRLWQVVEYLSDLRRKATDENARLLKSLATAANELARLSAENARLRYEIETRL